MGQKTSPTGFRLAVNKKWKSVWFANKKDFGNYVFEDKRIRDFLMAKPSCAATSYIGIKRMSEKIEVTLHTARPGLVIGKKGAEIDLLKQDLKKFLGKEVWVEVAEIKRPDLDAQLVADWIAKQLEKRVSFRKVLKRAIQTTMEAGAVGVHVQISGRIGGAEIARPESYKEGRVPRQTLRAHLHEGRGRAETTYGSIGVKVVINTGEQ